MKKRTIISCLIGVVIVGITVLFYSNFSLYTNYVFSSDVYEIENNYIYGVSSYTDVYLYKRYFDVEGYILEVDDVNGYISNGSELVLLDKNKREVSRFINIIKGDIVSDGIIDTKDIDKFREYLGNSDSLKDYQVKCLDINEDDIVDINDFNLLEDAISGGIKDININLENIVLQVGEKYRLVGRTSPDYGVNMNLIFSSGDEDLVSVDDNGMLIPKRLGSTVIYVSDSNNKIKKEVNVIVDNTIKLSSYSGDMFVSDPYVIVDIKSLSYDDIECVSSNLDIASCRVDKDKLYIKAIGKGEAEIRVISKEYGEVSYKLNSYSSSLDIIPDYYCLQSKRKEIINLGYIYDNVEVSNNKLLSKAYIEGNLLYIEGEGVTGREELIIRSNGVEKKFIIDMVGLTIPSIGTVINVGGVSSADIIARNTQKLSCEVPDSSIAECYIENNKVYVRGLKRGEVNLRITNTSSFNGKSYECGETQFLVVVR